MLPALHCPFCRGLDESVLVTADALAVAAISRRPINRHHVLVFPRRHVEHLGDLSPAEVGAVMGIAQRVSAAITLAAAPDAITLMSDDDLTGAGYNLVPHWKLHLIPRFSGEAIRIDWARTEDPGLDARAQFAAALRERLGG